MSVAKNVASNTSASSIAGAGVSAKTETSLADKGTAEANGAGRATNGETPKTDGGGGGDQSNGLAEATSVEVAPPEQAKSMAKSEAPAPSRKSSFLFNVGGGNSRQSPERGNVTDRRASASGGPSSRGSSPANATGGGSGPIGGDRGRKKSSECDECVCVLDSPDPLVMRLPVCSSEFSCVALRLRACYE